jgi:hypothetical protein
MERTAWTNERLDDLAKHIDTRFDGVDRRFEQVERRFEQMDRRFDRLDDAFRDFSGLLLRIGGGLIVGLVGVIAAVISTG